MPTQWTQAERLLLVQTPLGDDKLLLRSFNGTEAISQLFAFRLDLLSEDRRIGFDDLVGQNITWGVKLGERQVRYYNGYISRFVQLPSEHRLARYQVDVVPWLWFLTRAADCRIFQNKTVPEIIEEVFQYYGFSDFELHLSGSHAARDYCVQYRETSFNFVSRLAEEEGIFYFFRHENRTGRGSRPGRRRNGGTRCKTSISRPRTSVCWRACPAASSRAASTDSSCSTRQAHAGDWGTRHQCIRDRGRPAALNSGKPDVVPRGMLLRFSSVRLSA